MSNQHFYQDWCIPLLYDQITLGEALDNMRKVGAAPQQVPLMVQLIENPRYKIPGLEIFHGAVDLAQHDCIHIILGRGLLSMDEAFTIGFTMGSTNKVSTTEEKWYALISRYLYPQVYQFNDSDIRVFKNAIRLGFISQCKPLDEVDFTVHLETPLNVIRNELGLEPDLLLAYYRIEHQQFPAEKASQRLLQTEPCLA